ncbi:MAG: hypothetical protein SPE04_07990 [Prevotella sp.]|nr:hypothetical protein [Prevotella sp.]
MANQATTTYKVTGTRKAVNDLWSTLQKMEVNSKNIWLYQFGRALRHRLRNKANQCSWSHLLGRV